MNLVKIAKKLLPQQVKEVIKRSINTMDKKEVKYDLNIAHQNRLNNKVVIVTGGSGAIGSAICYRLVAEGATVGVCGRNIQKINKVIEQIDYQNLDQSKVRAVPIVLDVTNDVNIEKVFKDFVHKFGRIDVLINNAGGGARSESKPLHLQSIEVIDYVLNTNLRGSILCARKAAQQMIKQKRGTIINMSSIVGMQGKSKMSDYAASKAGIIGFTKSLAIELGEYNINVNCISPGMVNQIVFDRGIEERSTITNSLGRFGKTDDVANLVAFLVSDEASYITGQNIVIDGGRSLGLMGDFGAGTT